MIQGNEYDNKLSTQLSFSKLAIFFSEIKKFDEPGF